MPMRVQGARDGDGARGMGQGARVGSYGPNIPPRKIAAIHTPMLVSTYIHIYFLKLSKGIVLTHIDH